MSYTSDTDESIECLRLWNSSREYIIVATQKRLYGDYVVFEPNYQFTLFEQPALISQSKTEAVYLYRVLLPCKFNPYLYLFFNDHECSAVDLLGNTESDNIVYVKRFSTDIRSSDMLESREMFMDDLDVKYDINEIGELIVTGGKTDSSFCSEKYSNWERNTYNPYYYLDKFDRKNQMRIVYTNNELELELTRQCMDYSLGDYSRHTIYEFTKSLQRFFVRLFNCSCEYVIEYLQCIYREYFDNLSPKEKFDFIGKLVLGLKIHHVEDDILQVHYIIRDNERIVVSKDNTENKNLFTVTFYPSYLTVQTSEQKFYKVPYENSKFDYGFLLL